MIRYKKFPIRPSPNQLYLAPMVRVCRLGSRLLAQYYGVDAAWTEEIIDHKLVKTSRIEKEINGLHIIQYILERGDTDKKGKKKHPLSSIDEVVVSTSLEETVPIILQIGSSDSTRAALAAKKCWKDFSGIDLNCGCPAHFSTQGNMGGCLLDDPSIPFEIISRIRKEVPPDYPISAKIRLLKSQEETISFIQGLEKVGTSFVTIHARYKGDKRSEPVHWKEVKPIVEDPRISIPVIINGGLFTPQDILKCRELSGCSTFMIARAALYDLSIFQKLKDSFESDPTLHVQKDDRFAVCRRLCASMCICHDIKNVKFSIVSLLSKKKPYSSDREEMEAKRLLKLVHAVSVKEGEEKIWEGMCECLQIKSPHELRRLGIKRGISECFEREKSDDGCDKEEKDLGTCECLGKRKQSDESLSSICVPEKK
eukprot:gnl/Carplike_NY0171/1896_a2567_658.p1 GENE.gnl/Carplike_NY0171/1896_a2567_658~~gnl/Carplike_NY0171/1896_a2567_658.p1  ORF type:complete len:425 (+),score=96.62 gnl/Carplike_NY0171/1896_a2567_658:122-1396(+)